jgi:hypothetical protein
MLIRSVDLVLENCEVLTIEGKYIGDFYLGDIRQKIARMACNHIGMEEICHSFYMEIHKDASKDVDCFGIKTNVFERLQAYSDITQVTVRLYDQYAEEPEEDVEKRYLLHWGGDSEYENEYQKSLVADTGWLYIVVEKDKSIEDVFDLDSINDAEHADFIASMYDIGDKYYAEMLERHKKE